MKKIIRKIHNKIYNWWYGIKPLKGDGCYNVGVDRQGCIVKMDWGQRFEYLSPKIGFKNPSRKKIIEWSGGINTKLDK